MVFYCVKCSLFLDIMSRGRKWAKDEDSVIVGHVRGGTGLSSSFRKSALELGRSESAVRNRWYSSLRYESWCFVTVGDRTYDKRPVVEDGDERSILRLIMSNIRRLF